MLPFDLDEYYNYLEMNYDEMEMDKYGNQPNEYEVDPQYGSIDCENY
jgi:hypothetical protein